MTEYKFANEVRKRAEQYAKALLASGYSATVLEHTFRDYTVKLSVEKSGLHVGNAVVYYKASQKKYTLGTHELKNKDFIPELQSIWHTGEEDVSQSPTVKGFHAYVDGSFIDERIGFGAVILQDGKVLQEFSGSIHDESEQFVSMQQVGGEIQAVYEVLGWASQNNVPEIELYFDYEGLESWANGTWKAKNAATVRYQTFMKNCPVKIIWHKVKGHSGDRWNEYADELARRGAQGSTTPDSIDPIQDLEDLTNSFVAFLVTKGIEGHFDQIYNEQHARIIFSGTTGKNYLDIYNTKKVHLEPKWHGFSDAILREKVRGFWEFFRRDGTSIKTYGTENESSEIIGAYLEILRPYRDLDFDFVELARMVEKLGASKRTIGIAADEMRYDFGLIEKTYENLVGDHHG